ncbi:MAG: hypothetical protein ACLPTF_03040 [Steroidobacteraceae bacterium]
MSAPIVVRFGRLITHVVKSARCLSVVVIAMTLSLTAAPLRANASGSKSISEWVTCGGTTDQTTGAMAAFAAARNNAFTLIVDCAVHLHSGLSIDRGIFIDNGTMVQFTSAGKFYVDNMFHPAFVIANSNDISLIDWNVEWDGSVPVNPDFGGYEFQGKFVTESGTIQPSHAFNDIVLTNWLAANRGITFNEAQGTVKSIWVGGVNAAAVFFITGDSHDLTISGMNLYVPSTAGGNDFMPMAFSTSANWNSNQTVTAKTPATSQYAAVPQWITFSGIELDGTLMGWQGNLQDSTIENVTSRRYGDLQDADGGTVGGIGKWFPPPHLVYLINYASGVGLDNNNIHISNVNDQGYRTGVARDKGGTDSISGYANSLKLGCNDCSVYNYMSNRPDGFMDVLPSYGLTVELVFAAFDSQFLNNLYPAGIRFPSSGYSYVTFENVVGVDQAAASIQGPIGNATSSSNVNIAFSDFQLFMSKWSGSNQPLPTIAGGTNDIAMSFTITSQLLKVAYLQNGALTATVQSSPTTVTHGASTALKWSTGAASSCNASGAWSGSVGTSGSRMVKLNSAGGYNFTLVCENSTDASSTTMSVVAE